MYDGDEVMSFLPLCHIFERLFSVMGHITHGYIVNFIESPDTVTDNMMEISPTVGYAVPRIWEKYLLRHLHPDVRRHLVQETRLLRRPSRSAASRATLMMNFKPVPLFLESLYRLAYLPSSASSRNGSASTA